MTAVIAWFSGLFVGWFFGTHWGASARRFSVSVFRGGLTLAIDGRPLMRLGYRESLRLARKVFHENCPSDNDISQCVLMRIALEEDDNVASKSR